MSATQAVINPIAIELLNPDVLVLATTTGQGVESYMEISGRLSIPIVAVSAHKIGNPRWKPFDLDIRERIEELGGFVVEEDALWALQRIVLLLCKKVFPSVSFKSDEMERLLGVGGRVCLQAIEISVKKGLIQKGQKVVAMAGKYCALVAEIKNIKPIEVSLFDIIWK